MSGRKPGSGGVGRVGRWGPGQTGERERRTGWMTHWCPYGIAEGASWQKGRKARRRVAVLISLPSANDRRAYSLQHLGWRWAGNTNSTIYPNYSTYGCTRNTDKKPLKIIGREWHGQWKSRIKRGWNRSHVATHRPTIRRWCGIEFIFFFFNLFCIVYYHSTSPQKTLN